MLENGVFNRPYVRDITKICECACSMNCDKNATELRPDRNPDIITNADRIRAMSDEELAKFFDDLLGWTSDGYEEHLNWLRKPAKDD